MNGDPIRVGPDCPHGDYEPYCPACQREQQSKRANFDQLDTAYDAAHEAWGQHVDTCPDCAKSPFACKAGMDLHERWNDAWQAARAVWKTMSQEEKDTWLERGLA